MSDLQGMTIDYAVRVSKVAGRDGEEAYRTEQTQVRRATNEIKRRGAKVGKRLDVPEKDQSGWTAADSPAWQEAIRRVAASLSDGIAFGYDHRHGRNHRRQAVWFDAMEAVGGQVLFADHPDLDYRTDEGRQVLGLASLAAEKVISDGRKNSKETVANMIEEGIPNRVPYGYRRNLVGSRRSPERPYDPERAEKSIVPDEETADVVRRIFRARAAGGPGAQWGSIADALQADGIPAPQGGPRWSKSSLAQTIAHEAHLGVMVYGKRRIPDSWEPIIDLQTWRDAQSERRRPRTGRSVNGLAGGLLVCPGCGRTLAVHRGPGDRFDYACRRASGAGRCPLGVSIGKVVADELVETYCKDLLAGVATFDAVSASRELDAARAELDAARVDSSFWATDGSLGLPAADVLAGTAARRARIERAQDAVLAAEERLGDGAAFPQSEEAWDGLTLAEKRKAAQRVIDRIEVAPWKGVHNRRLTAGERLTIVPR